MSEFPSFVVLDEAANCRESNDDDLDHIFCGCSEDRGLCGADLTDVPEIPWGDDDVPETCVVCLDLEPLPCARCNR